VRPSLLWLSLALQLGGGVLLAVLASPVDLALYTAGFVVFFAYSTPVLRTKSHPWLATATVALGSGAAASLAGSLSAGGESLRAMLAGMLSSSLFIAGFYPLTQLGQIEEDRRRGDRTFAVAFGRGAAFAWAGVLLPLAASMSLWRVGVDGAAGAVLLLGFSAVAALAIVWFRSPRLDATAIADWLAYGSAAVFAASAWLALAS
jgi:1,4-dihydroxy-2-naphthoate octaprenyltransferase